MGLLPADTNKTLQRLAAICFLTVANIIICFIIGFVVLVQAHTSVANLGLADSPFYHYLPLILGMLSAAACNAYIVFNHKIRDFIKK
jgi:hypothetical protein